MVSLFCVMTEHVPVVDRISAWLPRSARLSCTHGELVAESLGRVTRSR